MKRMGEDPHSGCHAWVHKTPGGYRYGNNNAPEIARLETLDNGKPIRETMAADVPMTIDCLRHYAGLADKIQGDTIPVSGNFLNHTLREPMGVVGQIIPWNFSLLMAANTKKASENRTPC